MRSSSMSLKSCSKTRMRSPGVMEGGPLTHYLLTPGNSECGEEQATILHPKSVRNGVGFIISSYYYLSGSH